MVMIWARYRGVARSLAGLLAAGGCMTAGGCGGVSPSEPPFSGPGRFVATATPYEYYRGGDGVDEITADTLWLMERGAARRVEVTYSVRFGYHGPAGTSTATGLWTGTWQASGAVVRAVISNGSEVDTLQLMSRRDGGLDASGYLFARR